MITSIYPDKKQRKKRILVIEFPVRVNLLRIYHMNRPLIGEGN
jgi:hypothetical protein